jgi:hypothetical protein
MDLFNLILAIIFLMMATQWTNELWLIGGMLIILIVAVREWKSILILVVAAIALYFIRDNLKEYALFVIIGLILLALLLGKKAEESQPEMFSPGGFGGLMEGI